LIKRKDGAKIIVERSSSSQADFKLTFDDNRQTVVQNPDALMFPSYILGWHEIEQAATDPNIRQVYLDTIAGGSKSDNFKKKLTPMPTRLDRYIVKSLVVTRLTKLLTSKLLD
jgi:hypothetical protein